MDVLNQHCSSNKVVLDPLESSPRLETSIDRSSSSSLDLKTQRSGKRILQPLRVSCCEENELYILELKRTPDGLGFRMRQEGNDKVVVSEVYRDHRAPVVKHGLGGAKLIMEHDIILQIGDEFIENFSQAESVIYSLPVSRYVIVHMFRIGNKKLRDDARKQQEFERRLELQAKQLNAEEEAKRLKEKQQEIERKAQIQKMAQGSTLLQAFNIECETRLTIASLDFMYLLRDTFADETKTSYTVSLAGLTMLNPVHVVSLCVVLGRLKKNSNILKGKNITIEFGWREIDRLSLHGISTLLRECADYCDEGDGVVTCKAETVNTSAPTTSNKPFLFGTRFLRNVTPALPLFAKLQNVVLSDSKLSDINSKQLLHHINKCKEVRKLDVSQNKFGQKFAEGLTEVLCDEQGYASKNLEAVSVKWNELGSAGGIVLFTQLRDATACNLVELDLSFNGLTCEVAPAIRGLLESNTVKSLRKLNLAHNRIQHQGGCELALGLRANTTLEDFFIGFNQLGFEATVMLIAKCKTSSNILALHVENTVGDFLEAGPKGGTVVCDELPFQKFTDDVVQYLWDLKEHMNMIRSGESKEQIEVLIEYPYKRRERILEFKWFHRPLEIEVKKAEKKVDKLSLAVSIFKDRCKEADSRSFFDTGSVVLTAMAIDWKLLCPKLQRFIKEEDQIPEIKALITRYYFRITNIFRYYAAIGDEHDCLGFNEFIELVDFCKIPDRYSCPDTAAQGAFVAANVELEAETKAEKEAADNNPDNAMCQYEFVEALIRLALRKFCDKKSRRKAENPTEAVKWLMEEHVFAHCSELDSNVFRRDKMYYFDVTQVLETYRVKIEKVWKEYAGSSGVNLLMRIEEWRDMLVSTGLAKMQFFAGMKKNDTPKKVFDPLQQKYSFWAAQSMTKNILTRNVREKSRNCHDALTYTEFLEALVRLADSVKDPTVIEYLGLPSDAYLSEKVVCVVETLIGTEADAAFENAKYPALLENLRQMHVRMKYQKREDHLFEVPEEEEEEKEEKTSADGEECNEKDGEEEKQE